MVMTIFHCYESPLSLIRFAFGSLSYLSAKRSKERNATYYVLLDWIIIVNK